MDREMEGAYMKIFDAAHELNFNSFEVSQNSSDGPRDFDSEVPCAEKDYSIGI